MKKEKSATEKLLERCRARCLRELEAHRVNALRADPAKQRRAYAEAMARSQHHAAMPTGQITAKQARKIDGAAGVGGTQLSMFGG